MQYTYLYFETEVNLRVNLVHSYDEEEYLFNNYDFHGHWVRGSGVSEFFSLALIIHIYFNCNTTDTQVTDKAHGPHQFTQKRSPNH